MKKHNIPLESLTAKSILRNGDTGKVLLNIENGELHMITLVEGLSKKHQNYAYIPDKFKLPFRTIKERKTNKVHESALGNKCSLRHFHYYIDSPPVRLASSVFTPFQLMICHHLFM